MPASAASSPHLVFAGHTDVVPPGDAGDWTHPPFAGEIADGTLYGRGAVDMKGAVACAMAAALDHLAARGGKPKGSISFLITGDEEGIAVNGTVKLLKWAAERGERFDHCILGEPSNAAAIGDTIKVGRRGSLNGTLVVTGKQGHVAYPERADNPVRGLVTLMSALMAAPLDHGSAHFDASNLEFTSIDIGNPVVNLIPGEARARFNIRFNDCHSQVSLKTLIEKRAAEAAGERVRWHIDWEPSNADLFVTEPGPFVDLVVGGDQGGDRRGADALDHRRHLGRALHQGLLPGAGIRPGRADHAPGRRAHRRCRSHDADGGLSGASSTGISAEPRSGRQLDAGFLREIEPLRDVGIDEGGKASGAAARARRPARRAAAWRQATTSTVLVSALIFATISRGVPAGANKPNQPSE